MPGQAEWHEFFQQLDEAALAHPELLNELLPGGHWEGNEYRCGNINGGGGDSFGFNGETGIWTDFGTGERGGVGATSLYARVHACRMGEAGRALAPRLGVR